MSVRVLLVDNHESARVALAERLRRDGRLELVGAVAGTEEAQRVLDGTPVDVVLLDLHTRRHDGAGECRMLRALTDAPLVLLVSFMTPEHWEELRQAGASAHLLKHIDTQKLSGEIARLASGAPAENGA